MRSTPLPDDFRDSAFDSRDARAAGVSPRRLRARDLVTPFHRVRSPATSSTETVEERCLAYLPRLTAGQFFCGSTAAALYGVPLPLWTARGALHVGAIPPDREPRTAGVIGHRLRVSWGDLSLRGSFPVPAVAETWAQLGSELRLDDLIVAADHILHHRLAELDELKDAVDRLRRRGAVDLRDALVEARAGSESPKETRTRLVLVRGQLPEPELNWVLRDGSGRFLARLDMAFPQYRVAVEYDGRHHADHAQFAKDADRWAAIEARGWILIRVLAHHLANPERDVVARTRRALHSRGWYAG